MGYDSGLLISLLGLSLDYNVKKLSLLVKDAEAHDKVLRSCL